MKPAEPLQREELELISEITRKRNSRSRFSSWNEACGVTSAPEGNALMLCDDVKRVVYFFLDGTLSSGKHHDIELHLNDCPGCEVRISVHRRLRTFVKSRLTPMPAPESLRIRVSQSLRTSAATSE